MILIGISGKARSGKDTAADILVRELGLVKYSFSKPIKDAIKEMFGLTDRHVNGDLKEEIIPWLGVSSRVLMQTLGTDWGRNIIREDIWIEVAKRKYEELSATSSPGMVISDVRFENEADFIRKNGGVIIHLSRPGAQKVNKHISEKGIELKHGDICVINDGSTKDLEKKLKPFILHFKQKVNYGS